MGTGRTAIVITKGNPLAHIILRGAKNRPNYDREHVDQVRLLIARKSAEVGYQILQAIGIDASHDNSGKVAANQIDVVNNVSQQIIDRERLIKMVMIESHLVGGKQNLKAVGKDNLKYGMSITDECVDLEVTFDMLKQLSDAVKLRRRKGYAQGATR